MLRVVEGLGDARVETPQTNGDSVQNGSYKSVPILSCDLWRQKRGSSPLAVFNSSWGLS